MLQTITIVAGLLTTSTYLATYTEVKPLDETVSSAGWILSWFRAANGLSFSSSLACMLASIYLSIFLQGSYGHGEFILSPQGQRRAARLYWLVKSLLWTAFISAAVGLSFAALRFMDKSAGASLLAFGVIGCGLAVYAYIDSGLSTEIGLSGEDHVRAQLQSLQDAMLQQLLLDTVKNQSTPKDSGVHAVAETIYKNMQSNLRAFKNHKLQSYL